jgi:hypothetical protein
VEFKATTGNDKLFGLTSAPQTVTPYVFTTIEHAFDLRNAQIRIRELGTYVYIGGNYVSGDSFKIERIGADVMYYHNGNLIHTSSGGAGSGKLYAQGFFRYNTSQFSETRASWGPCP